MEEKSASNSKKPESEVSPGLTLESKRKRKPNSFIFGNDFDTSSSEVEPRDVANNLSQTRPQWRQQWRRSPSSISIPQNPVLPTTAPMQPKATNSASKIAQTASKVAPKTASIQQNLGNTLVLPTTAPMQPRATNSATKKAQIVASNVAPETASKTTADSCDSSEYEDVGSSGTG